MTLVITVEDGSGVPNANSYISVEDADAYFGARLYSTAWTGATKEVQKAALIQATRTLDNYIQWDGIKADPTFDREFPRVDIYETQIIDGVQTLVELVDMVPKEIPMAECELAIWFLIIDVTSVSGTEGFKKLNVPGAISFEVDNGTKPSLIPALVFQLVSKYGTRKGSFLQTVRA